LRETKVLRQPVVIALEDVQQQHRLVPPDGELARIANHAPGDADQHRGGQRPRDPPPNVDRRRRGFRSLQVKDAAIHAIRIYANWPKFTRRLRFNPNSICIRALFPAQSPSTSPIIARLLMIRYMLGAVLSLLLVNFVGAQPYRHTLISAAKN